MVDATAFLAPYPPRRVRRPVRLRLTDDTYPLEVPAEQSWLSSAFRAFARLAGRRRVRDLLIVGSGNGLDALGAAEIFPHLRSLAVTDLFEACLAVTRENVLGHLADHPRLDLQFRSGDLLAGVPAAARFDLVYENLPNMPATAGVELWRGSHNGRFFDPAGVEVPPPFGDYRLALHYRCLAQARPHLHPGGGVLTAIGGRMPREVAFELHRAHGYVPELVVFDVKLQSEPDLVLPGYREVEQERRVTFTFFAPEAIAVVAQGYRAGLDGQALADAVEADLRRLTIPAVEAEQRWRRGQAVAHAVFMILGTLRGEARA